MRLDDYADFVRALTNATQPPPIAVAAASTALVADRFAIYRNNVHVSLIDALADNHPTVAALVGREFFDGMARAYAQTNKPRSSIMLEYGMSFPDFIEVFPPAANLAYLADVARFDRAWLAAWAAAEAPAAALPTLQAFSPESLADAAIAMHPAAQLIASPWPVAAIWQAHQADGPNLAHLVWQAEAALITRPEAEVLVTKLEPAQHQFIDCLARGQSIAQASAATTANHPHFDAGSGLGLIIDAGMVWRIATNE